VCSILESREGLEVCGEAANGEEAVVKSFELNPSLVVLDVWMPVLDGFSAAKKITEVLPHVPILMFSSDAGSDIPEMSQLVGAQGFVKKTEIGEVLLKAVDVLLAGGTFFPKKDNLDAGESSPTGHGVNELTGEA
jgi:DNA-binding NarL/FixJ family response regulator